MFCRFFGEEASAKLEKSRFMVKEGIVLGHHNSQVSQRWKNKGQTKCGIADHLSCLSIHISSPISDSFPDEHILEIKTTSLHWYPHIVNYL